MFTKSIFEKDEKTESKLIETMLKDFKAFNKIDEKKLTEKKSKIDGDS